MSFPEDVLADEEEVVLHLRPHWKAAVAPVLVLLLAVTGVVCAWVLLPSTEGGRIGLALVAAIMLFYTLRNAIHPLLAWRCTHYVVTSERILLQHGIVTRERRDLPLNRINDHATTQTLLDRMFGCGTLVVDSIGEQRAELAGVPDVHRVQTTLYELIEFLPAEEDEDEEPEPELPKPRRGFLRR